VVAFCQHGDAHRPYQAVDYHTNDVDVKEDVVCRHDVEREHQQVECRILHDTRPRDVDWRQEFDKKFGNYDISTRSFAYNGGKPVIIDFYAVWCGPCKVLSPIIEELAEEYKDKAEFFKVDVDSEKQLATRYGISSIPTLFFISAKGEVRVASGLMSKPDLKAVIDNMLLK